MASKPVIKLEKRQEPALRIAEKLDKYKPRSRSEIIKHVQDSTGYSRVNVYWAIKQPLCDFPEVNHKIFVAFQEILKEPKEELINPKVKAILWFKYEEQVKFQIEER